jgi:predicted transcriptional regulator
MVLPLQPEDEGSWRDTYFTPEQWARVPGAAGLWHTVPDPGAEDRLRTAEEINIILHFLMVSVLTPRQRQVMELYYLEDRTQSEVATALGISQATISQHLNGKLRNGTHVGGAFRRIRKAVRKAAARHTPDDSRYAEIITALNALLDTAITRRRARHILKMLAHSIPGIPD